MFALDSCALLGTSDSGKKTLLRCILGRPPTYIGELTGELRVFGKVPGTPGATIPGPGVGYMPAQIALHPELDAFETLHLFKKLYGMPDEPRNGK